ncbi:MAG: bifunctional phosphoglucose/phosphomannose isomerase [Solirubrobacterales bacterium]
MLLDDVLAIPEHLGDALWRVDSARMDARPSAGLLVCGMGGSAIGGDLAAAVLSERLTGPLLTVRGYSLPSWASAEWTVLCSSYSGETEETLSCFDRAGEIGARRIAVATGGSLVDRAREGSVPVVGLPGILQPRAAVAYMFVAAAEAAALAGIAPRVGGEIEAAAGFLRERTGELRERAAEVSGPLQGRLPLVCGAELTAPVARRWKTQINENAKLPAFYSELPEADHNEICGWVETADGGGAMVAVLLEDPQLGPRLRLRFDLTADAIAAAGTEVVRVQAEGESRSERLLWTVMLGDLISLELASARGVDPLSVKAIETLKSALSQP